MPRVKGEEQDYIDNPDDPDNFPEIVNELDDTRQSMDSITMNINNTNDNILINGSTPTTSNNNNNNGNGSTGCPPTPSFLFSYFQQQQQIQQQHQQQSFDNQSYGHASIASYASASATTASASTGGNSKTGNGNTGGGYAEIQLAPSTSSTNHYNRLTKSSSQLFIRNLRNSYNNNNNMNNNNNNINNRGIRPNVNLNSHGIAFMNHKNSPTNGNGNGHNHGHPTRNGNGPTTDVLNDTLHFVKGKGILASTKDVMVSPAVFAEGCKLLQAAALGNASFVQTLLIANPENIYFRDYDRRTALHVAASEGKLNIVKMLIEKYNAPINRSDRWGGSPLDDAHRHRQSDIVAYLRKKGASTGSTDQTTNLITAAVTGDLDELRMLLNGGEYPMSDSHGNSSNGKSKNGKSNSSAVTSQNVDVNAGDYDRRSALHLAAAAGHTEIVKFLIRKGANVNGVDAWGGTPLDDAIRTSNLECIRIIKENGGNMGKRKIKHTTETSERTRTNEDKNLNIDFDELDVIDKIGSGAFGEIFKCRWRGTLVAAKCIKSSKIVDLWRMNDTHRSTREDTENEKKDDLSGDELQEALKDFRLETSILRTLRHPNICMLLGYSHTDNFEVMISELMKCSLLDVFTAHFLHGTTMSRKTQIIYAQQLARGMNYLHKCKPPIIHRDLKPANLLIDFSGTLKITDFGLAKVRPDPTANETQQFRMTGETGSYRFMAPEVFRHEEYTETVDVYSFAMIFYYLVSGRPPWETLSGLNAVIKAAVEADRPIINRSWDNQISSLMQRCWDENPTGRPSFGVILNELREYSKNVLKMDIDHALAAPEDGKKCCCVIS